MATKRKSTKLEMHKMLALSTTHVEQATANWLDYAVAGSWMETCGLVVYPKGEYGWFIPLSKDDKDRFEDVPEDLVKVIRFAERKGASWIMFDRDVPEIDELPAFEW